MGQGHLQLLSIHKKVLKGLTVLQVAICNNISGKMHQAINCLYATTSSCVKLKGILEVIYRNGFICPFDKVWNMKSFGIFASVQFHAQREISLSKMRYSAKIRLQLETGKWPDHSDRGNSMTSLVECTHTHAPRPCWKRASIGTCVAYRSRIFVEIAIVTWSWW